MHTRFVCRLSQLAVVAAGLAFATGAGAAEPPPFAAVYPIGRTPWVELARLDHEPAGGRRVTLGDDFFHAYRRTIPGARPLGTAVRLVGPDGALCEGTLGRPAVLGLYYGDEGFGGDPIWIRAAPVRGCAPEGFSVAVTKTGAASTIAHAATDPQTVPALLARAQARATLGGSAQWLAARAEWAASYTDEPVATSDRTFEVGDSIWALADDGITAECGTELSSRVFVHRAADGAMQAVPFPGSATESLDMLGDLDGDGHVEVVLGGGFGGSLRIVSLAPGGAAIERWSSDGIPFFGCPC